MVDYKTLKVGDKLRIVGAGAYGFANLGDVVTVESCDGSTRCDVVHDRSGEKAYFALTCGAARLEAVVSAPEPVSAESFGLQSEMQPVVDELRRRMRADHGLERDVPALSSKPAALREAANPLRSALRAPQECTCMSVIRDEIAGQIAYAESTEPHAGRTTVQEHRHTAGVLKVMLMLLEFRAALRAPQPHVLTQLIEKWRQEGADIIAVTSRHPDPAASCILACANELEMVIQSAPTNGGPF